MWENEILTLKVSYLEHRNISGWYFQNSSFIYNNFEYLTQFSPDLHAYLIQLHPTLHKYS